MQFVGQYQKSFTIPTGATSGARITIDGDRGAIFVYSAAGNLINSIASVAGSNDGYGNAYPAGETAYGDVATNIPFTNLLNGIIYEGFLATRTSTPDYNHSQNLAVNTSGTSQFGAIWTPGNAAVQFLFSQGTGTVFGTNAPSLQIQSPGTITTGVYASIIGALVGGDPVNGIATWQTPTYNANWADSNAFNTQLGQRAFRYIKTNRDSIWMHGCAAAVTGAGSVIGVLPVGYRPLVGATNQVCMVPAMQWDPTSSTVKNGMLRVDGSGNMTVSTADGFATPTNGTQMWINGEFPLGNIP